MELSGQQVTIVGAGIGGLTAALALARRGARVEVLEQAPQIVEVGAGLQISPNALRVFAALGLGDAIAALGVRAAAVELCDGVSGARVLRLDLARLGAALPYHFVHRADLIALLERAAGEAGVTVMLGARVESVTPRGEGVTVRLDDEPAHAAEVLVGADGLHSKVRVALNGSEVPFFTGQAAWRATVGSHTRLAPVATVFMGTGRHLVRYPLRGGELVNIVGVMAQDDWLAEGWTMADDPKNLRAAFADFVPEVRDLLERVTEVRRWGLFRHQVAPVLARGACALLGDAAHPTLPFLAQGAAMAIEDAWVLADRLARAESLAAGLADYARVRRPRVQRIVATANRNARAYHLAPSPLRFAAHAALRLADTAAPGLALKRFDWLYRHDVTVG